MDSGFQVLDYSLYYQWNLDSVFQSLVGFWIPRAVFQSPGFQVDKKNFPRFRNPDSLTLGDVNIKDLYGNSGKLFKNITTRWDLSNSMICSDIWHKYQE